MASQKDLDRALRRVADLEAMLDTIQGNIGETPFKWKAYDHCHMEGPRTRTICLPERGRMFLNVGKDRFGREHELEIFPSRCNDGTPGICVRSNFGQLRILPEVANSMQITCLDPRDVPDEASKL